MHLVKISKRYVEICIIKEVNDVNYFVFIGGLITVSYIETMKLVCLHNKLNKT
jgi:hypothetical protein